MIVFITFSKSAALNLMHKLFVFPGDRFAPVLSLHLLIHVTICVSLSYPCLDPFQTPTSWHCVERSRLTQVDLN